MKLNEFAAEVHRNAVEHGWWDKPVSFGEIIVMCHSELSEAVEEYRKNRPMVYYPCNSGRLCVDDRQDNVSCGSRTYDPEHPDAPCKARSTEPKGVAVELGDCILRILDYCCKEDIDIDAVIESSPQIRHTRNKTFGEFVCDCHYLLSMAYYHERSPQKMEIPQYLLRLAGCITDILDWAGVEGVDMEAVMAAKHAYNKGRPYRHGGKRL